MLKKPLFLIILVAVLPFSSLFSQVLVPVDSIKVIQNGKFLNASWAGGLNNAQFSEIDLNNDGKNDLFVFDRNGNRITTYLNKGGYDTIKFVFEPSYVKQFPKGLSDWVLLRDLNCDSKPDVLSSAGNGIKVYYNTSTGNELSFELATNMVNSNFGGGLISNLYVSRVDIPAIVDMDNDGDMDVLTFPVGGTTIEYHKNYSIENGQGCNLDNFMLEDACWGKVKEDFATNSVYLNQSCRSFGFVVEDQNIQHAGSTVFAFDHDGDGDQDVVLGDISFPKATYLKNGGTVADANIVSQDTAFPNYDIPVDLYIFPSFYSIDVNNDGHKDIIASPNGPNASDNYHCVWYYKDTDTSKAYFLEQQQRTFLQDQMIDVGEGAYPTFFDYNADGLKDLIIGNYSYKVNGVANSKIVSYKNTGTSLNPQFTLDETDYAGLLQYAPLTGLAPCFGDIDGDGDDDMLVGNSIGQILYLENYAGAGNTAMFILRQSKFQNIDVGNYSKPVLYDINKDGRLDLIIGSSDGKLSYYQDTLQNGLAGFKLIKKPFGNVNISALQGTAVGYASPAFVKENGNTVLYTGSANGGIIKYTNIDGNFEGTFAIADSSLSDVIEGYKTHPAIADLNNDGYYEMIIGNYAGGVRLYTLKESVGINGLTVSNIGMYPNPANDYIKFKNLHHYGNYKIYNLQGTEIKSGTVFLKESIVISDLQSGIYIVKLKVKNETKSFRIIKL